MREGIAFREGGAMSKDGYLPPGVTTSMLPGNRPEDMAWDKFHEEIDGDCDQMGLGARDAGLVWELGLLIYRALQADPIKLIAEIKKAAKG